MRRFFGKIALLALAAVLSHGFVSCSDSGEEGNYTSSTGGGTGGGSGGSSTTATYTVTFHETEGSGTMSPQTGVTAGVPTQLKRNTFTAPSGKQFKGWAETEKGDPMYVDGGTITKYENIDLYAVWGKDGDASYTVKHFKQEKMGSTSYIEVPDSQRVFSGSIGSPTTATANTYDNYRPQPITQKTIYADNSTVVDVRYDLISETGVQGVGITFQSAKDLSMKYDSDSNQLVLTGDYIDALLKKKDEEGFDIENYLLWYIDNSSSPLEAYPTCDFDDERGELRVDVSDNGRTGSRARYGVLGGEKSGQVFVIAKPLDVVAAKTLVYSDIIYVSVKN